MNEIDKIRKKIDKVDNQLIKLLEERFKYIIEIGNYKKNNHISVEDLKREGIIFDKIKRNSENEYLCEVILNVYNKIIKLSKEIQYKIK